MSDRRISDLVAELQPKAQQFLTQANAALTPSKVVITTTWRSPAEQAVAHAAGLSKAAPGQSPHECELADGTPAARAFDWAVLNPDGSYVSVGTDPRYATCGAIVMSLELVWGGTWTLEKDDCEPDFDHAELVDWRDV